LFDHNGDGIRTGTGWVNADDAWLALDRDGNGSIDSGRELFGVDTEITVNGVTRNATSGFEALSALDSNGDGVFNAADAQFANVRLWRDLNQDGQSQAGELISLAQADITSIGLTSTGGVVPLGNGNSVTGQATVIRGSGSNTTVDGVSVGGDSSASNLNIADNPFYRQFSTSVPLTSAAQALPDMTGSGWVRDLREAMSLGTPEAQALEESVAAFAGASTRDEQLALLDQVLLDWARTNQSSPLTAAWFTNVAPAGGMLDPSVGQTAQLSLAVPVLEVFNGHALQGSGALYTATTATNTVTGETRPTYVLNSSNTVSLLKSYDALRTSVYSALVVQTRLQPYLDTIGFVIDEPTLRFDTSALSTMLATALVTDPAVAIADLVDLNRSATGTLRAARFDGLGLLASWCDGLAADSPLWSTLTSVGVLRGANTVGTFERDVFIGDQTNQTFDGGDGDDLAYGGAGADILKGSAGNDQLQGGAGADTLYGGLGDDILDGGSGNDMLMGDTGNNTYMFGLGDGQDTVGSWNDASPGKLNVLRFKVGVAPTDLVLEEVTDAAGYLRSLEVSIAGTSDKITISGFLSLQSPLDQGNPVQRFEFDDGTSWDLTQIQAHLFAGTPGADVYRGTLGSEVISGQAGNDFIEGMGGNDTLDGGEGVDTLQGSYGNDTLIDGEVMSGFGASDTYVLNSWYNATINADSSAADSDLLILPPSSTAGTTQVIGRDTNADGRPDNLVLKDSATGSEVTVANYFLSPTLWVNSIRLGDGTVWTVSDIAVRDATHAGTAGNDTLYAYNWGGDVSGLGGNDTLWGYTGNDRLDGGAGNDLLSGGAGADTLIGGDGNDSLDGDFSVYATANDGADVLDGGAGDDTIFGGGGNDIYRFGRGRGLDRVTDTAGANRVQLDAGVAPADVTLFREGLNLILVVDQSPTQMTIVDQFHASGARVASIEFADGTVWDAAAIQSRTVAGTPNAMTGTAGNDSFIVDDVGDTIIEGLAQGTDTALSSVSYTLPTNVENLTLTGYLNSSATGNALDNSITGNSGNNTLYGVDGADTLIGGVGDDTYKVNWTTANALYDLMSNDTIVEAPNGGIDTVTTSVYDFTLPANVENLLSYNNWQRLSGGTGAPIYRQLVGNDLDNFIDANAMPVVSTGAYIDGGAGADTMRGTSDNDTYVIDNLNDVVIETGGVNGSLSDTVMTPFDYTVAVGIENITLTGSAPITATGSDAKNVLDGSANSAANMLVGGLGDDTYRIGAGDVIVEQEGQGNDTVVVAAGAVGSYSMAGFQSVENASLAEALGASGLEGNDGDNVIAGNTFGNVLSGLGGNDTITDGAGATDQGYDTLLGGAGNDTLTSFYGQDRLDGGAGDDLLQFARLQASGTIVFGKGMGNDVVVGGWANAIKRVEFKADTQPGDVIYTRNGADLIASIPSTGDSLTLSYFFGDAESWTPTGEFGTFDFTAENLQFSAASIASRAQAGNSNVATAGNDVLLGAGGNDTFAGLAGNDTLTGGDGDDDLAGGADGDYLYGGGGNDTYRYALGDGFDVVNESGGTADRVRFVDMLPSDIAVRQFGSDLWFLRQSTGEGLVAVSGFYLAPKYEIETAEFSDGTTWDNATLRLLASQVTGTSGADDLTGSSGADSIYGLAGNDTMNGLDGDDLLDGGTGNDSMIGGLGNDTFIVDSASDVINEASGQGNDTAQSSVTYTLSSSQSIENLVLTGTSAINGTGNTLANTINGNSAANTLSGGTGADTLIGGAGNDIYVVDNAGDAVTELAGEGVDLVQSSVTYTLAANLENLTLTGSNAINATGNALDNVLTGNSGTNTLTGGAGNDTYVVGTGDTVVENANEGTDTVQSSITWTIASTGNVENLTLTGSSAISATGNALDNVLTGNSGTNTLTGGAGNDTYVVGTGDTVVESAGGGTDTVMAAITWTTLAANVENLTLTGTSAINGTGNTLNNVLTGNSGANTLDGGTGADTLIGGAGNDTYVVDNASDVITELTGEGTDLVQSSVTYTLAANVENITLTGSSAINATGNALDNVLTGNSGTNTLAGGAGNDTYVVGTGDTVTENANEGIDTVQSSISWTLGSNIENLTLTGSSAINATGNALDNVLTGNSGTNTLTGGAGNDTYVVGTGDTTTEAAGAGTDTVMAGITWTLATNLENLTQTGTSAINGTGNTADNVLIGNTGANTLSGLAGNDTYDGLAGNDALTDNSTTSNDVYRWGTGYGVDTITDSGGTDRVEFGAGITAAQLVFAHVGNNLEVTISGNSIDKLVVSNYYVGTANKIETFRLSDGSSVPGGQLPASIVSRETFAASDERELASTRETIGPVSAFSAQLPTAGLASRWPYLGKQWLSPVSRDIVDEIAPAVMGRWMSASAPGTQLQQQVHVLLSAMAAFDANHDAATNSGRETIQPVHRPELMWVSPAMS
jgi:Ca2+-binding RTX toxin-like protein